MHALVLRPYRDRETLTLRAAGDEIEATAQRIAELEAGGFVAAIDEQPPDEPSEDFGKEPENHPADEPKQKSADKMTVDELKAAIAEAGGFLPKNAKKPELIALYEAL